MFLDTFNSSSTSAVVNPLKGHGSILRPDMVPTDLTSAYEMTHGQKNQNSDDENLKVRRIKNTLYLPYGPNKNVFFIIFASPHSY